MNYRHAYHAGNFADVVKHAVLALVLEHMTHKPAPFRVIDTHAGIGRYDLGSPEAQKTGEWRDGIGRLLGPDAEELPAATAQALEPYLRLVRGENPGGGMTHYPGSPLIARHFLRAQDRLIATELHPDDCAALAQLFRRDRQTKVLELDGWVALRSLLPPTERRAVVLIDPPYEARDEFSRLERGLTQAVRRFATGCFLLWYPMKDPRVVAAFHDRLRSQNLPPALVLEVLRQGCNNPDTLNGCGLVVVNPPWTLVARLEIVLPVLAERLATAAGAGYRLDWLVAEPDASRQG